MSAVEHRYGEGLNYPAAGVDPYELLARPAWMADALCREYPHVEFVPRRGEPSAAAIDVCRRCLVRGECLSYALEVGPMMGIWGGSTAVERHRMAASRRRAAAKPKGPVVGNGAPRARRDSAPPS